MNIRQFLDETVPDSMRAFDPASKAVVEYGGRGAVSVGDHRTAIIALPSSLCSRACSSGLSFIGSAHLFDKKIYPELSLSLGSVAGGRRKA
ncbi:hypothetical protein M2281_002324 [Mesorhizobium soli]|nr:hypothetical protein [Mesorhizobium soli]